MTDSKLVRERGRLTLQNVVSTILSETTAFVLQTEGHYKQNKNVCSSGVGR